MKKKILLLTAIATLGLTTATMAQNVPNYVPTNGLVGWWPFNGNANDESGNGNNGTVNGATLTADRFGNTNKAFNFNGVNQNIEVANSNSLNPIEISISVWIYPLTNDVCIISKNDPNNATAKSFRLSHQDFWQNQHGLSTRYGSVGCNVQNEAGFYGSQSSISNNIWSHIVTTVSATGMVNHYLNGIFLESNQSVPMVPCNNTISTMRIGGLYWNGEPNWFNGIIDDIGIWNRVISQQEITDLYNGCQLSVNTQPSNQQININNYAQFIVGSTDPIATFQWQTDLGVGFQNLNSVGQYSGTTNDTLTVSNVTMSNNNQPFRCIVSSGSCSDTSNVAVLTVNNNVGINENTQDNLFSVFPNPAQSVINVKADSKLLGQVYSIYDNTGRVVLTGKLNSENTTIELGNLSGGVFMFRIGENMKQTFKLIKE